MSVTTPRAMVRYTNHDSYIAAGSASGDILLTLTAAECSKYDTYMFLSPIGIITVEVELVAGGGWSLPIALQDMTGTLIDQAAVTVNNSLYGLVGKFSGLRVKASGAAASVNMTATSLGRKT
jgi:hypothetical protein